MYDPLKYIDVILRWLDTLAHDPKVIVSLAVSICVLVFVVLKIKAERAKAFNRVKLKNRELDFTHKKLSSHTLTLGASRSGKTVNILFRVLRQSFIEDQPSWVYDYKNDLADYIYHLSLTTKKGKTENFFVNFHDPSSSHRVNPLAGLKSTSEAIQLAKSIISNFNKGKGEDSYWTKCATALLAATIWYFHKNKNGKLCHLPAVIEFLTAKDRDTIVRELSSDSECAILASPIISTADAVETISSQISSIQADLSNYSNKELYWILSSNSPGFTGFDLNSQSNPVRLCVGNNPQTPEYSSPLVSLLAEASLMRMVSYERCKSSFIIDEAGTVVIPSLPTRIATVAGYGINIHLLLQDFGQLQAAYSREMAQAMRGSLSTKLFGKLSEGLNEVQDLIWSCR